MKRLRIRLIQVGVALGLWNGIFFSALTQAASPVPELRVLTYDSLAAPGGLGPEVVRRFEVSCGCRVRLLGVGDSGLLVARLRMDEERRKPSAHLVWGVDQWLWPKVRKYAAPPSSWQPERWKEMEAHFRLSRDFEGFLPFDGGPLSLIVDRKHPNGRDLPGKIPLRQLSSESFRKRLILEDPRTSGPGLALERLSRQIFSTPSAYSDFWRGLREHWLALFPGWSAAYGAFLKGEAPVVWSYLSSLAYHRAKDPKDSARFETILFEEGQPLQVEGAFLLKGAHSLSRETQELALRFLNFLLSDEVQKEVPRRNWMLPVIRGTPLPDEFQNLPKPVRHLRLDKETDAFSGGEFDAWLRAVQL